MTSELEQEAGDSVADERWGVLEELANQKRSANSDLERALNHLETEDAPDAVATIAERGPERTSFHLVGERDDENYDDSRVHFLFPGVLPGPDESFTPVVNVVAGREDVYAPDRTGDFSAEHALNGIVDILKRNPNYQKVEIFAVSVGACIAKALDSNPDIKAMNESGREIMLTYYDPFDLDDFAFGINADKDSTKAKLQRLGLKNAVSILPWLSKLLGPTVLKKGGIVGEDSSLDFLLGQFAALGDTHIVNPQTNKYYYEEHISGSIEAGTGTEDKENHDIFMDKRARFQKMAGESLRIYGHIGLHGATDDVPASEANANSERKNPTDAYRNLLDDSNWWGESQSPDAAN